MKAHEILNIIQGHKGQTLKAIWESPIPCLKAYRDITVVKRTQAYVISGIEFANRKEVKEAIESGERGEVQSLPWGTWKQYPFIIEHVNKAGQYNEYIRLYPPTEQQAEIFHLQNQVEFFANGQPITREIAIQYCGAKAQPEDEKPGCMTVNAGNILAIG